MNSKSEDLWVWGVVFLVAFIVLVKAYSAFPDARETIAFATALVGGLGALFGTRMGFHRASESARERRRARALQLIDQLNTRELLLTENHLADGLADAPDGYAFIVETPERRAEANHLLGLLEDLALWIRKQVADEQTLYDSLSFALPATVETFRSYIEGRRRAENDRTIYQELEGLADAWREGRSYCSRERLHDVVVPRPYS